MESTKNFGSWLNRQQTKSETLKESAKIEIKRILEDPENIEPDRGDLNDPGIKWRHGKPDFTIPNISFLMGKSQCHAKDSLEILVENVVKTWKMESSNKADPKQWKSVSQENFKIQANGGKVFGLAEAAKRGDQNVLLDQVDTNIYDASKQDFESSHHLFSNALTSGFSWEVLSVFTGPPEIVFSFRHWGEFTGKYDGKKGHGQLIEMIGFVFVSVTDELKITNVRVFYKPEDFLRALKGQDVTKQKAKFASAGLFISWLDGLELEDEASLTQKVEEELREMLKVHCQRPDRGLNDSDVSWKFRHPHYALVDLAYLKGKTCCHKEGSVESVVENLMKTCELEFSHKVKRQWKALSKDCELYVNGENISENLDELTKTFDSLSHNSFPWEVLEVFSTTPDYSFTWRHWMEVKEIQRGGKITTMEIKGFALMKMNEKKEIETIKVYYKPDDIPDEYLKAMRKCPFSTIANDNGNIT